jgi:lysophospholipase L1-like esterase
MRMMARAAVATFLLGAVAIGTPAQAGWITSWTAAPQAAGPAAGSGSTALPYSGRTLRETLRLSAGGTALRVRFSNAYSTGALAVGGARIAILDASGKEIAGSSHTLTFGGAKTAIAAKAAPLLSDPVSLRVPALARVAVSLYLPGEIGACSCHQLGLDDTEISAPGDFSGAPFQPEKTVANRAFLAAVEVDAPGDAATVAVMGDSISDGVGSTPRANHRWPDLLAERLAARGGNTWGVANEGISGNRVLGDGAGESVLARLDRDVFSLPGVKAMILFEGVNDLGLSFGHFDPARTEAMKAMSGRVISAAQMIAGYRQIIARAHLLGIKVIGATIAPYKGASYWSPEGEAARQEINAFIRTGGAFDGMLDFDKVLADPADMAQIKDGLHAGDHLHGNDAGYRKLADSIDLGLFGR